MTTLPGKFIASLVSAIVFSLVLSYLDYTPVNEQDSNTYYYSFLSRFLLGVMYISPLFVTLAMVISVCIEKVLREFRAMSLLKLYVRNVLLYLIAGVIVGVVGGRYFADISNLEFLWRAVRAASFASLLYYHVLIIVDVPIRKLRNLILQKVNQ